MLRSHSGLDKKRFAKDNLISVRSVDRYIKMLRDEFSMPILKKDGRFKIQELNRNFLQVEDFTAFSLTEAEIIKNALLSISPKTSVTKEILNKLYVITDLEEICSDFKHFSLNNNITGIRRAIKQKKKAVLKDYASANSATVKDRIVEPIKFGRYYESVFALDTEDLKGKFFKTERILSVEILDQNYEYEHLHHTANVDDFGMTGIETYSVKLKLSLRAANLLKEEYPSSRANISAGNIYQAQVKSLEGIGRFCMGLLHEIDILEGEELREYLKLRISDAQQKFR